MKKLYLYFTLLLLTIVNYGNAQTFMDSVAQPDHKHRMIDDLYGSGTETVICYKQTHRNIYLFITFLIIIIAIIALKLLSTNKKTSKKLKHQNEIIQEKNKSITDSINYARRLQNAILPPSDVIKNILPEHFLFYQPKDIVSGDFYWVSEHDDKFMVAAIDCTGHGVPGAMLSIVGYNAIAKTVNELKITRPDEVLMSMNSIIKNILHQDESSDIKDGMDMALCTFDRKTYMLEYAGANNPIYIVSNGNLTIIKASKLTVGSIQKEVHTHPDYNAVQLKKNDCFYIFSDGYADQFGGKENKKFKTSRLKELLLAVNNKSMPEQMQLIKNAFSDWKGSIEQVDDVLVIGIKV